MSQAHFPCSFSRTCAKHLVPPHGLMPPFCNTLGGAGTESKLGGSKLCPEGQIPSLPIFIKQISLELGHHALTAHGCLWAMEAEVNHCKRGHPAYTKPKLFSVCSFRRKAFQTPDYTNEMWVREAPKRRQTQSFLGGTTGFCKGRRWGGSLYVTMTEHVHLVLNMW